MYSRFYDARIVEEMMALSGQLKDFNLLQLLALVQKTGKSGAVTLDHWGQTATVFFHEGRLTKVKDLSRSLAAALLESGRIDRQMYDLLGAELPEKAIALHLSDSGVLSRAEVEEFARRQMVDDLQRLFAWRDGTFTMDLSAVPSDGDIVTSMDLAPLLSRAHARMSEWQGLVDAIPGLDVPLSLVPEPPSAQLSLSRDEWRLVSALAAPVPLAEVARRMGIDEFAVRKLTLKLVTAGLASLPAPAREEPEAKIDTAQPVKKLAAPEPGPVEPPKNGLSRLLRRG